MADFGTLAEMLEELQRKLSPDLQQQVEEIKDALGRLQVEVGQQEAASQAPPSFEPPTESPGGDHRRGGDRRVP